MRTATRKGSGRTTYAQRLQKSAERATLDQLPASAWKMLNLATDWLNVYLPFCLQKVNRVTFGMLTKEEKEREEARDGLPMAETRWRLALKNPRKPKQWLDERAPLELTPEWMEQQGGLEQGYEQLRPPLAPDADAMFSTFNFELHSVEHRSWLEAEGTP